MTRECKLLVTWAGTDGEDDTGKDLKNLTGRQNRLFELRLKMNEARKANQTAMVAEKKRMEPLEESRGISKQKWLEERKKIIGRLLDANGLNMSKAYMLDTQDMAESKYKKWEKEPTPAGWDVLPSLKDRQTDTRTHTHTHTHILASITINARDGRQ
ncbi:unnamed protein product [Fraxinus pennsylvanica]|uniref:Uncharacterized protein n=1 Tax=Fraxinus pennsylvanica TaxID=56036 RepID=A0AAD1ZT51_9LAMI|nr:unnamed protein product [Fraxinus pennsylvanica]